MRKTDHHHHGRDQGFGALDCFTFLLFKCMKRFGLAMVLLFVFRNQWIQRVLKNLHHSTKYYAKGERRNGRMTRLLQAKRASFILQIIRASMDSNCPNFIFIFSVYFDKADNYGEKIEINLIYESLFYKPLLKRLL